MTYKRYRSTVTLSKQEKKELFAQYISYYEKLIEKKGIEVLNVKLSREMLKPILDQIGTILIDQAKTLVSEEGKIKQFLDDNPLPPQLEGLLPNEVRAFSLLLNALKQWVSAESTAIDHYILGGTAKKICRSEIDHCIVTGKDLGDHPELHYPIRDGRLPILMSKKGHLIIEHQLLEKTGDTDNSIWYCLKKLKSEHGRSWIMLREGCEAILTENRDCRVHARSFAKKVIKDLNLSPNEIIKLLDQNGV